MNPWKWLLMSYKIFTISSLASMRLICHLQLRLKPLITTTYFVSKKLSELMVHRNRTLIIDDYRDRHNWISNCTTHAMFSVLRVSVKVLRTVWFLNTLDYFNTNMYEIIYIKVLYGCVKEYIINYCVIFKFF